MSDPSLPSGYELRRCQPSDIEAVANFHSTRTHPFDGEDFRLVAEDPSAGPHLSAIVIESATGAVVASLTLLDEVLRVGSTTIPAGQVELVATATAHEGRGLVRSLMAWSDQESARRGHLVQPMVGIPYFYRQFGYEYAMRLASWTQLTSLPDRVDKTVTVRRATTADTAALLDLHKTEQDVFDVAMAHSAASWAWLLRRSGSTTWVAVRDEQVVASARTLPAGEGSALGELVARDAEATRALITDIADGKLGVPVQYRPETLAGRAIASLVSTETFPERDADWAYVRIPDLVALLNRLRPELQKRLDAATLGQLPDQLLISSYRSSVVAGLQEGQIGPFMSGGPVHFPVSAGGLGIPPDALGALLIGTLGALELERQRPDVQLGACRDLAARLFPAQSVDLSTFYLAT